MVRYSYGGALPIVVVLRFMGTALASSCHTVLRTPKEPGSLAHHVRARKVETVAGRINSIRGGSLHKAATSLDMMRHTDTPLPPTPATSDAASSSRHRHHHSRRAMYATCLLSVLLWIGIGTILYSHLNHWPYATGFFYAVDAGMSIGFCTDVAEHTVRSRAFSIGFILAGASVIGGALALFVADTLEGVERAMTAEYRTVLELDSFRRADGDGDGALSYEELGTVLREAAGGGRDTFMTEEAVARICETLDRDGDGKITQKEFAGTFRTLDGLVTKALEDDAAAKRRGPRRRIGRFVDGLELGPHRMYLVFSLWLIMGIAWGMTNQKWDPITATHFAVSALATGGLTAPPVNAEGVLPNDVAIFVGLYCLLGIPLFYLAMGHFAKTLVKNHLVAAERKIIRTPLRPYEFALARHLCTRDDFVHLSDFMVLHFLRRGMTDLETIKLIRAQFESLDRDGSGRLSFKEATSALEI